MEILESLQQHLGKSNLDRVYGNCHSTLIGTVVNWWLERDNNNYALEAAPGLSRTVEVNNSQRGKIRCDAEFYEGKMLKGLLEVEGTKYTYILEKIREYFFQSEQSELRKTLQFAIIIFYPSKLNVKNKRDVIMTAINNMKEVIGDRSIWLIFLDREPDDKFVGSHTDYYHSKLKNTFNIIEINKNNFEIQTKAISQGFTT